MEFGTSKRPGRTWDGIARRSFLTTSIASLIAQAGPGKPTAVLVGVSRYAHPEFGNLSYPARDVQSLALEFGRKGYAISALTDLRASSVNVLSSLSTRIASQDPNQPFVFVFSGHGFQQGDKLFLLVHDSLRSDSSTSISCDALFNLVIKAKLKKSLLLIDACRKDNTLLPGLNGFEDDAQESTVFMGSVLDAIRMSLRKARGTSLSAGSMIEQAVRRTANEARRLGRVQQPQLFIRPLNDFLLWAADESDEARVTAESFLSQMDTGTLNMAFAGMHPLTKSETTVERFVETYRRFEFVYTLPVVRRDLIEWHSIHGEPAWGQSPFGSSITSLSTAGEFWILVFKVRRRPDRDNLERVYVRRTDVGEWRVAAMFYENVY